MPRHLVIKGTGSPAGVVGRSQRAEAVDRAGPPPLDLDLTTLPGDALITDIVYAPTVTADLRKFVEGE